MNVGGLLVLMVVAVAAVMGIIMIGANHNTPYIDTYNHTFGNTTNETQSIVINATATGSTIGGGVILLIAFGILMVVLVTLVLIATKKPNYRF